MNEIGHLFVQLESSFIRTINKFYLVVDSMASTIEQRRYRNQESAIDECHQEESPIVLL